MEQEKFNELIKGINEIIRYLRESITNHQELRGNNAPQVLNLNRELEFYEDLKKILKP